MKLKIRYEKLNEKYVDEALDLIMSAYIEEKSAVPFLPDEKDLANTLKVSIRNLFNNGIGVAAISDDELIGFIAGFEVKEFFGKCKGIYSPLYGHGCKKEYRTVLYQELYKLAAELWIKKACLTHAITLFADDKDTIKEWFWQGFGLRCVDAIREVVPICVNNPSIIIAKADIRDIPALANIHRQHNLYYRSSPIFMPNKEEDPVVDLTNWLKRDNHHLWAAYQDKKPLGYMRIQPSAETFVSEYKDVMNITGAYVVDAERKTGVGTMLLGTIQDWLLKNGYTLCGVDFESINTAGSSFWNKHFTTYTYSMVRRIDERILD
jgi:GNAT superfamily N-acetyltransferase